MGEKEKEREEERDLYCCSSRSRLMRLADDTTHILCCASSSPAPLPPAQSIVVAHQICARDFEEVARIIKCDVYKKRINRLTTITLSFNESALHSDGMAEENY